MVEICRTCWSGAWCLSLDLRKGKLDVQLAGDDHFDNTGMTTDLEIIMFTYNCYDYGLSKQHYRSTLRLTTEKATLSLAFYAGMQGT